jgi:N-acetylglutamate synthase-like GNAT family acetyltransferase
MSGTHPPAELAQVAENRRITIINYVVALVALAKARGMSPAAVAGWLQKQYAEAGWYDEFLAEHGPGNLTAFAEEFVSGRRLLHDRSSARIEGDVLTVRTDQFDYRSDFSACFFFGIAPEEIEEFFDAVVALHSRRIGFDARLSRDARHETLVARPAEAQGTADAAPAVREARPGDLPWIRDVLTSRWGGVEMVTAGGITDASACPALIASADGRDIGLLTFRAAGDGCEIVSVDALEPMRGAGRSLVSALQQRATRDGWPRVVVVTTNDNLTALAFYQRLGFRMTGVEAGAVTRARVIKPSIPEVAGNGLPVRDEIRLEWS